MTQSNEQPEAHLPRTSPRLLRLFAWHARRYVGRRFNAVRVLRSTWPELRDDQPVIFYANHPGWWDPLVLMLLAQDRYPDRRHHAPIDAAMLRKYAFFQRLGFFGVEQDRPRGAATLLRAGRAVLALPRGALWITAEGCFTDVRKRPVVLRPGLAHLARRTRRGSVVPVALEYTFWHESTPEALLAFGRPIELPDRRLGRDVEAWQRELSDRLELALDRLATASQARDPRAFENLLEGRRGVGGVYDLWRRGKAFVQGERFDPSHARISGGRPAGEGQR